MGPLNRSQHQQVAVVATNERNLKHLSGTTYNIILALLVKPEKSPDLHASATNNERTGRSLGPGRRENFRNMHAQPEKASVRGPRRGRFEQSVRAIEE